MYYVKLNTFLGRYVKDANNQYIKTDYDVMPEKISRCRAHIDHLEAAELAEQEAEKERLRKKRLEEELSRKMDGLKAYLEDLEAKLGHAKDQILTRVSIAIQFENPHSAAQDAQKCINDLESVRAGANRVAGKITY